MKQSSVVVGRCPECDKGELRTVFRNEDFEFDLGNEKLDVHAENVPVEECDKCGAVMSGPAAAKVRDEALRRAAGLLTPADIKAIRDAFGWSQQYLADLTGLGIATISRWERGRLLQNRSNDKMLRAIRDCRQFHEYLEMLLDAATNPDARLSSTVPINRIKNNLRYCDENKAKETAAKAELFGLFLSMN